MYIERQIKKEFFKRSTVFNILALVGARQSGKTTFLKRHIKDASYVLFDDPDAKNLFEEDIKKFEIQYIKNQGLSVLDEVHYCNDAGRNLKYLADKGNKIWLTSSSEILLKKEVLSYLVGRVSIIRLYPFSLREFFDSKNIKAFNNEILKRSVWEHMAYGGYPKVITTEDKELKITILRDLYETMVLKDIARTFAIENIKSLEELSRYLALNTGKILSYNTLTNILNISFQTIKKYLDAMEKSYLIIRISPFFKNKNKEIAKQPKVYFLDTGLRNSIINNFDYNIDGLLFENYVLSELIKSGFNPKFWRTKTKAEVDFVIESEKELIPIEVKLNPKLGKIESSFKSFIDLYKPKKGYVVNYENIKGTVNFKGCKVHFIDVYNLITALRKK